MTAASLTAVRKWRAFANELSVEWNRSRRSWATHIGGQGYADEETLIQPFVFPRFAEQLLGFRVGVNLAAEQREQGAKPDFTPADAVTHPFVFETKSTSFGLDMANLEQVDRYLEQGRRRIHHVVQTNLIGLRVYGRGDDGQRRLVTSIDLRTLLLGPEEWVATLPAAIDFARFLADFRFRQLTREEKIEQVRQAPEWNPVLEATDPDWLSSRLDQAVGVLLADVERELAAGRLRDPAIAGVEDQRIILDELHELEWRVSADPAAASPPDIDRPLEGYLTARHGTDAAKARSQYEAHVAYYVASRLLLVRIWEDLGVLSSGLHDGGFDRLMAALNDAIEEVVELSFNRAREHYRSLFQPRPNYRWYRPSSEAYVDTIYELANTYLGSIESDVLGVVYERLLERVDRKLLGQYYTPRDIIRLIWNLIDSDQLITTAEDTEEAPLVIDIATGSGGFLVELARRERLRATRQIAGGAEITVREWAARAAHGLLGVELQRFPAFLAEINLLIQLGLIGQGHADFAVPSLGIVCGDTLKYHELDSLGLEGERLGPVEERLQPRLTGRWFDAAVGNPPYIGEKKAAGLLARTRDRYPYWEQFAGAHVDYLYWFLIVGISKLRAGGRFGFITTEYWLRADGAAPLRRFIARHCRVERLLLFRDLRLFPDAPGQHSMVIVGERVTDPAALEPGPIEHHRPRVSIYEGANVKSRAAILDAMQGGATRRPVRTFVASASPNALGASTWSEVLLTAAEKARRVRLLGNARPISLATSEGVITSADKLTSAGLALLDPATVAEFGGPTARPGIFVLSPDELAHLGPLTDRERQLVHPLINTRDVYPYAAVAPTTHEWVLFLAAPPNPRGLSRTEIQELPVPDDRPNIRRHLERFRPILLQKTRRYRAVRPWWTIHNPRPRITARDGDGDVWADYALTSRWGPGGRLIVALARRNTKPASGLHALLPQGASAAYLVGIWNSTYVQNLSETLPPGMLRSHDVAALGLPAIGGDEQAAISDLAHALADDVDTLVRLRTAWPLLPETLHNDISLTTLPLSAWTVRPGPRTAWGRLETVGWAAIEASGNLRRPIVQIDVEIGIFGHLVVASNASHLVRVRVAEEMTEPVKALVGGLRYAGGRLADVAALTVPIDAPALFSSHRADVAEVEALADDYRSRRAAVDRIVAEIM